MTPVGRPRRGDDGAAALLVLGLASVLLVLALLLTALGAVAVARHRAAAAADLAALAAAARALDGEAVACAAARGVASAQGARLLTCALDGEHALVAVEVRPAGAPGRLGTAQVRARAGPVGAPVR